ncbi:hypothetical protein [Methylobacterium sp. Leaf106]|uniref:hypothetical protein n=1 Tax=Methylobacterium sp. Leaf106 TaxID=1736255 RepID=UPI0012E75BB8|nr:hypothetical protein [Methylobacterium sp. Leaf106]
MIEDPDGRQLQVSAVFHQDAHYLYDNRITLIGSREKAVELLGLNTDGVIQWELYSRSDWILSNDPSYSCRQLGTGWLRTSGMTEGITIGHDSIQPFADIEILKAHTHQRAGGLGGLTAEYIFLQRPRDWRVPRINSRVPYPLRLAGSWQPIRALNIRFRLLRLAQYRDDSRTAQEQERIELPGIEIAPIGPCADETLFFAAAERLWLLLRVLLVFRFRQFIDLLAEVKAGTGSHDMTFYNVRLEPRGRDPERLDPPFFARIEPYLAKGATALLAMENNCELLHAAAYGYATSYSSGVMESRLTACIEAIERLIEAFEQYKGFTRETINRRRWKKLSKDVRREAAQLTLTQAERDAINRSLSVVPTMHLIERIVRMIKAIRHNWRKIPEEMLHRAPDMIKARNDIVHGRLIIDQNALHIEILRAQVLFERLWLGLLNCGDLDGAGWPLHMIRAHEAQQKVRNHEPNPLNS